MGEHESDEFGKPIPTVFGSNLNDPNLTAFSAPAMITLAGIDEQATPSARIVPRAPKPGVARVPLWVWVAILVVMFLIGLLGVVLGFRSGFFQPPEYRENPFAIQQLHRGYGAGTEAVGSARSCCS